jgi:F-type H+-transporting ATPase subunit b
MLIDWFTVGAQLLNFLVLVWLMKRFLYKPILDAIDARENKVAAEIADADSRKADAAKEHDDLQQKDQKFDQERAGLISKAVEDANLQRSQLIEEAQKAGDELRAKRLEALQTEVDVVEKALVVRTKQEAFEIARKTLADLASAKLEDQIGEVFIVRLRTLANPSKESLRTALTTSKSAPLLRSAFELSPDRRAAIQTAVNETFSADIPIQFETKGELISGMELVANGQKLCWSIADYLGEIEQALSESSRVQAKIPVAAKV